MVEVLWLWSIKFESDDIEWWSADETWTEGVMKGFLRKLLCYYFEVEEKGDMEGTKGTAVDMLDGGSRIFMMQVEGFRTICW